MIAAVAGRTCILLLLFAALAACCKADQLSETVRFQGASCACTREGMFRGWMWVDTCITTGGRAPPVLHYPAPSHNITPCCDL
jgi:hypothetical protein